MRALQTNRVDDPITDVYHNSLIDSLLNEKPDLVGVSIPFITSYFEGMKLIQNLKLKAPDLPIVVGGSLIDTYHDPMIADPRVFDWFNYGMYGECDEAFPKLATTLDKGGDLSEVPNLYYRDMEGIVQKNEKKSVEDLNSLPTPDFAGLLWEHYLSPEPVASFQSSRGCYYGKCTFCSLSFRDNFRLREPQKVVEDMQKIHLQTGSRMFLLWDSLSPPKTLRAVAKEIKKRDLGFYFFAETKFEKTYLNREFIQDLADGGCRFLQFGMESASERILDLIDKGNKMEEVDRMLGNMADPKAIGPAMAVALLTTLYGAMVANTIFMPMVMVLEQNSAKEVVYREMVITGLRNIARGESPRNIQDQLLANLSPKIQQKLEAEAN